MATWHTDMPCSRLIHLGCYSGTGRGSSTPFFLRPSTERVLPTLMKRVFMLLAVALMVVATMALSGVAQADSPSDMCREKAQSLTGKNLTGYTFVVGTEDSNFFRNPDGLPTVYCGFDDDDHIDHLNYGDIFIGGRGSDTVDETNTDRVDWDG